jgi:cobalt-zinc-cadmium efflux system outer membrane protein
MRGKPHLRPVIMMVALLAAGCTSLPPEEARSGLSDLLGVRGIALPAAQDPAACAGHSVQTLADAITLGLGCNPDMRRAMAQLGFGAADVYAAGRLSNPRLGIDLLLPDHVDQRSAFGIDLSLRFSEFLLMPARRRIAATEYDRLQAEVGATAQQLASTIANAWFDWLIARGRNDITARAADAATARTELAQAYYSAGNLPAKDLARQQLQGSEARVAAHATQAQEARARQVLLRRIGVVLPEQAMRAAQIPLPDPVLPGLDSALEQAQTARLDLIAARKRVEQQALELGVTRRFRYLGEIDLGVSGDRDDENSTRAGPSMVFEVPLFDQGQGKILRAQSGLEDAEAALAALELDIIAEARTAHAEAQATALALRERLDEQIPAQARLTAELEREVNFMLADPFELLDARIDEYELWNTTVDTLARYWRARLRLAKASGTAPPMPGARTLDLTQVVQKRPSEQHHQHHHHDAEEHGP